MTPGEAPRPTRGGFNTLADSTLDKLGTPPKLQPIAIHAFRELGWSLVLRLSTRLEGLTNRRLSMEALEIADLFARRSIRRFTEQGISSEQIEMLLKAAMAAPSAGNRKPWHFVAVTDAQTRAAMAETHPYAKMVREATLCVVPCGDPRRSYPGTTDYWIQDVSAATENILLAAVGLGLGAVWCGVYPIQERVAEARKILGIPESVIPFAYIAIGYAAETKEPRTQYDPERVHLNRW